MREDSGSLEQGIPKGTLWMTQDSLKYDCIVLYCFPMVDSQNAQRKSCKSSFANPMDSSTPGSSVFHYLPEFVQTPIHWVGDAIQPSHPLSPTSPPSSIFTSIRVFYSELVHHIRSKYWSYSFSISSFNEYSGLTTFRIDWFDLLAVQGALKSLFQHHSLKGLVSPLSCSLMVWRLHVYWKIYSLWLHRPFLEEWSRCF